MLLNKAHCKKHIMETAKRLRPGWEPTQISGEFYTALERKLKGTIDRAIQAHPSRGKTIRELL
jgi:hypothetical protein